jgi:hypothetical protein
MLEPIHFVDETGRLYASVVEEMQSLYLLSFLLTADHDKASVSRDRRGVQIISPLPQSSYWTHSSALSSSCRFWKGSPRRNAQCAIHLRCSRRDVMIARVLALQRQTSKDVTGPLEILHRLHECTRSNAELATLIEMAMASWRIECHVYKH